MEYKSSSRDGWRECTLLAQSGTASNWWCIFPFLNCYTWGPVPLTVLTVSDARRRHARRAVVPRGHILLLIFFQSNKKKGNASFIDFLSRYHDVSSRPANKWEGKKWRRRSATDVIHPTDADPWLFWKRSTLMFGRVCMRVWCYLYIAFVPGKFDSNWNRKWCERPTLALPSYIFRLLFFSSRPPTGNKKHPFGGTLHTLSTRAQCYLPSRPFFSFPILFVSLFSTTRWSLRNGCCCLPLTRWFIDTPDFGVDRWNAGRVVPFVASTRAHLSLLLLCGVSSISYTRDESKN